MIQQLQEHQAIGCLADNLQTFCRIDEIGDALPQHGMVIGKNDPVGWHRVPLALHKSDM